MTTEAERLEARLQIASALQAGKDAFRALAQEVAINVTERTLAGEDIPDVMLEHYESLMRQSKRQEAALTAMERDRG